MEDLLPKISGVFLVVTAAIGLFHRLRLPGIVALIAAGVAIGPHGFGLLADRSSIEQLSELGIVLLMFSIGLDFDRDRLLELRRAASIGLAQIMFCIVVAFGLAYYIFDVPWQKAVFYGFLLSHTSSTLMLMVYGARGEASTAPARLGLGVSITQDLGSVPMLVLLPIMAFGGTWQDLVSIKVLNSALILLGTGAVARWVIPRLLGLVVQSRSRELILFFLMLVCMGAGWATHAAGLSAALGAFIAGLALAGSHYSHQIHAEVSPLRDILVSLFFISVGMLLNISSLPTYVPVLVPIILAVLVIKFLSGFGPVLAWGYPLRIASATGIAIAQIGEFSLVLALVGLSLNLIGDTEYQVFVSTSVLTMLLSPFLIARSSAVYKALDRLPFSQSLREGRLAMREGSEELTQLSEHVLIAGYGLNGKNLARALRSLNIPYAATELVPETVAQAQAEGEAVYYGDCTRPDVLRRMQIAAARVFVVAISDAQATRRAVQVARGESAAVHIIVRTRYVYEIEHLLGLGANEVIPEEFETSLEILARTLREYQVPRRTIDQAVLDFRSGAYRALRQSAPLPENRGLIDGLSLALEIETMKIKADDAAVGRTLKDLALPSQTGVVILAIRKGDQIMTVPPADYRIAVGDMLILVGTHKQLVAALDLLEGATAEDESASASHD